MAKKQNDLSYICLYYSYLDMIDHLTDEELGTVIYALLDYADDGTIPDFEGSMKGAFGCMRYQMQLDERNYQKRCGKKRRKSRKSSES